MSSDTELVLIMNENKNEPSPIKLMNYGLQTETLLFEFYTFEDCIGGWETPKLESLSDIAVSNIEKFRITFIFPNKSAGYTTTHFNPRKKVDLTDLGAIREYCLSAIKQEIFDRTNPNYYNVSFDYETKLYNSIYKIINGFDNNYLLTLCDGCSYKGKFLFRDSDGKLLKHYLENTENPRLMRKITVKVIQDIKENRGIGHEESRCCIC